MLSSRVRERETFNFKNVIIVGWAGMRGVVSIAAALAIPLAMPDGSAFPLRNLIIYLTFCVILSTLLLLGLTLPWLIRKLKIEPHSIAAEEYDVRMLVVNKTIEYIEGNLSLINENLLRDIKSKYEIKYNRLQKTDLPTDYFGEETEATVPVNVFNEFSKLQIEVITEERHTLEKLHREGKSSEEVLHKIERELDLEETRLRMEIYEG